MTSSLITQARNTFHEALLKEVLFVDSNGVPSNADSDSRYSVTVAKAIVDKIGWNGPNRPRLKGQTAGRIFEGLTQDFIKENFQYLNGLRPGKWEVIYQGKDLRIDNYEQYSHLAQLEKIAKENDAVATALGSDYLIKPDVIIARHPEKDISLNSEHDLVDLETARLTGLREVNNSKKILHASISCKWTIRTDRAQNARSEGLNLVRNRKGRLPHVVVITAEPTANRISSIAMGTGDIDCVYHIALPELRQSMKECGYEDASSLIEMMVSGKRLRDISDLLFDLVI